jgi:hypothetical protein
MSTFKVKVVGVTHLPGYPDNLFVLDQISNEGASEPIPAILERDAEHEKDPFAIEVHVPALGELDRIGYLPAKVSARLAPLIDAGEAWKASVTEVRIDSNYPDRPGIELQVERVG